MENCSTEGKPAGHHTWVIGEKERMFVEIAQGRSRTRSRYNRIPTFKVHCGFFTFYEYIFFRISGECRLSASGREKCRDWDRGWLFLFSSIRQRVLWSTWRMRSNSTSEGFCCHAFFCSLVSREVLNRSNTCSEAPWPVITIGCSFALINFPDRSLT